MHRGTLPLFCVFLCVQIVATAHADDWPLVRHDSRNTGFTPQALTPPLRRAWKVPAYSSSLPYLLASGGAVCVGQFPENMAQKFEFSLFESASGRLFWKVSDAVPLFLKGNQLLIGTGNEHGAEIQLYNWKTERLIWRYRVSGEHSDLLRAQYRATEENGNLYVSYNNSGFTSRDFRVSLIKLRLSDGKLLSRQTLPEGWGIGPPAVADGEVILGISGWLHVLGDSTLDRRWGYFAGGNAYAMRIGHLLLVQGPFYSVQAIHEPHRQLLWRRGVWREKAHCLALRRGVKPHLVVIETSSSHMTAYDPTTGRGIWQQSDPHQVKGLTAGAGSFIYGAGELNRPGQPFVSHGFYGWDARTGRLVWRYEYQAPVSGGSMEKKPVVVSDGSLYCLGSDGYLYRFISSHRSARRRSAFRR